MDAIFTPVRKVNFSVENMRVGDRTDYNRLILEIETDGTISPENALIGAATILVEQAAAIADWSLPPREGLELKTLSDGVAKKTKRSKK